ncbi:MAG TPA: permease [Rhizomicrobium sp.]|nr:permease [Rhizomicrobium sp.]
MMRAIAHALELAAAMGWEILWPLILGFALSACVQAVVSHEEMSRLLPDDRPKSILRALALGAASSSCSYAAVALARSIFRKGADFTAAMAFEMASTNLVVELSVVLVVLMGWWFAAAEFVGAPIMVAILVLLFRRFLSKRAVETAREQAEKGLAGRMEGHAGMDMAVRDRGSILERLASREGFTATSHYFVMDWASVWIDIALGLLIAGALAAWVPPQFWQAFFLVHHPLLARIWGPLVGPLVSVISFVCSVGNIPLAAVLWNGGISFGGVIAFIFADLIVLPVLDIYRKYYGWRMMGFLLVTFYAAMAGAAFAVEALFGALGLIPKEHHALVVEAAIRWNYTTWLNLLFLGVAAVLLWRFFRTGGPKMLRMMNAPGMTHSHAHGDHGSHSV